MQENDRVQTVASVNRETGVLLKIFQGNTYPYYVRLDSGGYKCYKLSELMEEE
jgi:hypothetical protein